MKGWKGEGGQKGTWMGGERKDVSNEAVNGRMKERWRNEGGGKREGEKKTKEQKYT